MLSTILRISIFLSLICTHQVNSANFVGLFDPYFVILFHPSMQNYDHGMQRFIKKNLGKLNDLEWLEERKAAIRTYNRRNELASAKQTNAMQKFYEEVLELRRIGIYGDELKKATKSLRLKYFGKNIDALASLQNYYLTDQQNLERLNNIFEDLSKAIQQVQNHRKLYFMVPIRKNSVSVGIKTFSHTFQFDLSGINQYWKLYNHLKLNSDKINNDRIEAQLNDYIAGAHEYDSLLYSNLPSDLIIHGDQDHTTGVLEKIYAKNNQSLNHAKIIGELYELWKKLDS